MRTEAVQGWPMWALCGLATIALVALLMRRRTHRLLQQERLLHDDRLRERERIARELHDMLVQSTQGFILTVQAAAGLVPANSPARPMLERALDTADQVLADGRDRVHQLRSLGIDPTDLPDALKRLGQALWRADGTRFDVVVEGRPRTMCVTIANDVYEIAREALSNAFRHAKPGLVEVQLAFADKMFRLRVRDDGRGFGAEAGGNGDAARWGLERMRERARAMGAKLDIRSHEGVGTEIELQVPARIAYLRRTARWW
ncbi:hypothetical protein DSM104443_02328 [Usitatibacter rugosus]|uniref:Histidine kinase/HSP90-like ATPase domain-containing protein n=1 Tax=Usitatibacter rugosus TaxID=2732067 RepID=A0A6M4GW72_9PROT|nr:histidine kinase [Usitatibacter rugosus]QJR11255.1 hypothetical protein DSM104443_02328 [Usitatibacter rugosus]